MQEPIRLTETQAEFAISAMLSGAEVDAEVLAALAEHPRVVSRAAAFYMERERAGTR